MIIHISGASGSGKTFLGKKLKEKYGNNIIVKDLDDLRDEFIKKYHGHPPPKYINETEYQKYIDHFIEKQKKPLILVGLNDNTVFGKNKNLYYDLHSQHNYYIDIDAATILKQKCIRFFEEIKQDQEIMTDLVYNNDRFIRQLTKAIKGECNLKKIMLLNNRWKRAYRKQGYTFMSATNIEKAVSHLIELKKSNKK